MPRIHSLASSVQSAECRVQRSQSSVHSLESSAQNPESKTSTGTSILTNKPKTFQNTGVMETGVNNHHLLNFSFLEIFFSKMLPNKLRYHKYKLFDEIEF